MLKLKYESEDEIPEGFASLYTEVDGAWHLTEIEGMKTPDDVSKVQRALSNEKTAHKETRDKLAAFAGLDPEDVQKKLDEYDELKALAEAGGNQIDEDKLNEMADSRANRKIAPYKRDNDKLKQENSTQAEEITGLKSSATRRDVREALHAAASKAKVRDVAFDDVLIQGERIFEIDDDGTIVTKDNIGMTPGVPPEEWLAEMREKKPHWWEGSQGAGLKGGKNSLAGVDNPWTQDNWNMTEQGRIFKADPEKAKRLASSAGVDVNATKPKAA